MADVAVATPVPAIEPYRPSRGKPRSSRSERKRSHGAGASASRDATTKTTSKAGSDKYLSNLMANMKWKKDFATRLDTVATGMTANDDHRGYAMQSLADTLTELFPEKTEVMPSVLKQKYTWDEDGLNSEFKTTVTKLTDLAKKRKGMIQGFEKYSQGGISDFVFDTIRGDSRFTNATSGGSALASTAGGTVDTGLGAGTIETTRGTNDGGKGKQAKRGKKGVSFGEGGGTEGKTSQRTSRQTPPDGSAATKENLAAFLAKMKADKAAKSGRSGKSTADKTALTTLDTENTKTTLPATTGLSGLTTKEVSKMSPEAQKQRLKEMLSKGAGTIGTTTSPGTASPTLDEKTRKLVDGLSTAPSSPSSPAPTGITAPTAVSDLLGQSATAGGNKIDPDKITATNLTDTQRSQIQQRMKQLEGVNTGNVTDATGRTLDTVLTKPDKWTAARTKMNETLRSMAWTIPPTTGPMSGDTRRYKRTETRFSDGDYAVLTYVETKDGKEIKFDQHMRQAGEKERKLFDGFDDVTGSPSTIASTAPATTKGNATTKSTEGLSSYLPWNRSAASLTPATSSPKTSRTTGTTAPIDKAAIMKKALANYTATMAGTSGNATTATASKSSSWMPSFGGVTSTVKSLAGC